MYAHLFAFLAVAALLTVSPGPDMAVVVRLSLGGRWRGVAGGLGVASGCFVWGVASAVGITALLAASTLLYDALRIAGAIYLCVLGVSAWRNRGAAGVPPAPGEAVTPAGGVAAAFRSGLVTNVLNPKVGMFYLSLLPTFVPPGVPALPATLLLVGAHALLGVLWLSLVAATVDRARGLLRRARPRRILDRITGGALVGFGIAAASEVAVRP